MCALCPTDVNQRRRNYDALPTGEETRQSLAELTGGIFCQTGLHGPQDARPPPHRNECADIASGEESEHRAGGPFRSVISDRW